MNKKQMEEKKREFRELEVQLYREMKENAKVTGVHDLDELDEKKWQWIEKLVEEVEREKNVEIIKRLKEYQLGLENYIEEYGLNRIESIKVNEFGIKDN